MMKKTYPFPNPNGAAVEICEWISYFIRHFYMHVIIYPHCDYLIFNTFRMYGLQESHQESVLMKNERW